MSNITSSYIGAMCHEFRRYKLQGITQQDIADDCAVSRELVSKFERGTLSNAVVFMWYIQHGIFEWVPVQKWQGWSGAIANAES